jgi:hypothetical protein
VQVITISAYAEVGSCGSEYGGTAADGAFRYQNATTACNDGTFVLTVPFGGKGGIPVNTGAIHWSAAAMIIDEDGQSPNAGKREGESLQAKLQALPNVGQVRVTRAEAPNTGVGDYHPVPGRKQNHHRWSVTFVAAPGNLAEMTVASNDISVVGADVRVETWQDGTDNRFYNYATELAQLKGQMGPGWLMVLPDSFTNIANTDSLEEAKAAAMWKRHITANDYHQWRENHFTLPEGGIQGRYVRYQLEGSGYLSLAEVQVYEARRPTLSGYKGGSPITATYYPGGTTYCPEQNLDEAFRGLSAEGMWNLHITDERARESLYEGTSEPTQKVHGQGAVSDWILHITDVHGETRDYYMDMTAKIETMPKYGNLFIGIDDAEFEHLDRDRNGELDRAEGTKYLNHYVRGYGQMDKASRRSILDIFMLDLQLYGGVRLQEEEGLQRYLSPCYGRVSDTYSLWRYSGQNHPLPGGLLSSSCVRQFGVGNSLSSSSEGSIAVKHQIRHGRSIRYVPVQGYTGKDSFSYQMQMGPEESSVRGDIDVTVKLCRGYDECNQDLFIQHQHTQLDRRWKWR